MNDQPAREETEVATAVDFIWIENITPSVDGGRFPAKRVVGDRVRVEADIFRDGHHVLRAELLWKEGAEREYRRVRMVPSGNDRWAGEFVPEKNGRYEFTIEAWTDRFATWLGELRKKIEAGEKVGSEILEGLTIVERAQARAVGGEREALERIAGRLGAADGDRGLLAALDGLEAEAVMERAGEKTDRVRREPPLPLTVDRVRARFSAWYEMFPRSAGRDPSRSATFREAEERLPAVGAMGFDVLYLPPIHPIGTTHRKGRDNTLSAKPGDPGSPWAIGSEVGGHDAVEPGLGTLEDFNRFVRRAGQAGLEVALDFAVQCSPDHPWVRKHPEWFHHRPDGTIKYAENPPKKYQDIFPINFGTSDRKGLYEELKRIVLFWVDRGVRIFRVDNPHTKPFAFWEWLISEVRSAHPDVIFLSEAFTRPKVMKALAKAGFSQSYTYFTWRNERWEFVEYLTELTQTEMREYFRPNFFTNTPDILSPVLQTGGPAAFKMRLALAATLSPSYGIYSGFELCENEAVPGTEEYRHSEKYEIRVREWNRPGNLSAFIATINRIRREHPALQELTNLEFLPCDNERILSFAKITRDPPDVILAAVNLDPHRVQEGTVTVPLAEIGAGPGGSYKVSELLTGAEYVWGERNYVRLDPAWEPAQLFHVRERPA